MTKVVAGIDIGGTNTIFGLVSIDGECISSGNFKTENYPDYTAYIAELATRITHLVQNSDEPLELAGLGVGAPNGSHYSGRIEFAPNLPWTGILNLSEDLETLLNVPVFITNDANAAAIGEKIFGKAKGMNDFLVVTLGTGLGGGIISNGKLLHGFSGFAGEIGHMIAIDGGRKCNCGREGCLEAYVSKRGMIQTAKDMVNERAEVDSPLAELNGGLDPYAIMEAANEGDQIAKDVFEFTGTLLGKQLSNICAILSPEVIFISGGISGAGDLLMEPVQKAFDATLLPIFKGRTKIMFSGLNEQEIAILGSAALMWEELDPQNENATA